ncbi:MAG: hypothetical protein F6K40_00110 [Okeania sp. SIO3I5]|uniref:hypothetical protein n=1 Tax=Okeania sp. SIO3I5 TaxID=2607805 RepID=UPI0013B83D38|nr:hypothetical protein [Okeania sp. SIO3I5]NEQ34796.1 hypothetical protein [Okeania sp. SIO3I5]
MAKTVELNHYGVWQSGYIVLAENNKQCLLTRHSLDSCGRSNLSQPLIAEITNTRPDEDIKLKGFFTTIEQLIDNHIKSWHTDTLKMVVEFTKTTEENGLLKSATVQLDKQHQKKLRKHTEIQANDIVTVVGWPGKYRVVYNTREFALVEGIDPNCVQSGWSHAPNYGWCRDFKHYVNLSSLQLV